MASFVVLFTAWELLRAETPTSFPLAGRVISSTVSGHGPAALPKSDVWWTYCIASADVYYSIISRQNPSTTGLINNKQIRFSEKKNQIRIVNPRGKNISLRILRKDTSGKCSS